MGGRVSRWWCDNFSQEYVARTRNTGHRVDTCNMGGRHLIDPRHGGVFRIPLYGHNLQTLVPAAKYADEHPEYYAVQEDGSRSGCGARKGEQHVELCLTNPDVVRVAAEALLKTMRANSDADMFFVGQSDSSNYCRCDRCVARNQKYLGRRSGIGLEFVNAIAGRVEEEFPDTPIGTFAYQPTYQAPENLKTHRNVVIWFCPITRCFCHPLHEGLLNRGFYRYADELEAWLRLASKVYVYDYSQGSPGADPPADLMNLPKTYRFYRRMGVRGVFVDALNEIQVGYGFLRYWLMTQLMNGPDIDYDQAMNEFLEAYYGAAAGHIRQFIELACDTGSYAPATEKRAAIWYPQGSSQWQELRRDCLVNWRGLSAPAIEKAYRIFVNAREAVADDAKARRHVESARMPVQYAMLQTLAADDPRLKHEAVSYVKLAGALQLRSVAGMSLDAYREKLSERLGMEAADWQSTSVTPVQ